MTTLFAQPLERHLDQLDRRIDRRAEIQALAELIRARESPPNGPDGVE